MQDREVTVSNRQAQASAEAMRPGDKWARITGIDRETGETVKFKMNRAGFLKFYQKAQRRPQNHLTVHSNNIISVE